MPSTNKYVILLRGINIGGHNIIRMKKLRDLISEHNYQEIATYIQTGNIILSSNQNEKRIVLTIKKLIKDNFNLDICLFIIKINNLKKLVENNPYKRHETKHQYFVFLLSLPKHDRIEQLSIKNTKNEKFMIKKNILYFYTKNGYGKSKFNNNIFENELQVKATTRNYNTIDKILKLYL